MADTAVEKRFADGTYRFWLPLPQVIEIERKCGIRAPDGTVTPKSIFTIYDQLSGGLIVGDEPTYFAGGSSFVTDALAVIRGALIGGNHCIVDGVESEVGPMRAGELIEAYCYPARPLIEAVHLAFYILHAAIIGIDVKKKGELVEADQPQPSEKAAS